MPPNGYVWIETAIACPISAPALAAEYGVKRVTSAINEAVRRRVYLWLTSVAVGLTFAVASVRGQEGDAPPEPPRPWYGLSTIDAFFEMEVQSDHRRVDLQSQPRRSDGLQKNTDWQVKEIFGLSLGGYLFNPRMLSFSGELGFGLTQSGFRERLGSRTQVDEDAGRLLRYNLQANLFTGSTISGSVRGLRDDDRISRRFQPSLRRERKEFGTSWSFAHDRFPMTLSYDYRETSRTGNRDPRNDDRFIESTLHYSLDWSVTEREKIVLSYEHAETKQDFQGLSRAFDTTRDLARIAHKIEFGDSAQHELSTVLRWQEESGDLARDFFEIGPQLTLNHTDTLQSRYSYQFNRERYQTLDVATHRLDWQLEHQLYRNLTTTFNAFGLHEAIDEDADIVQYGVSVDWQYQRTNRWGELQANLALAYDTEEARGGDGKRLVLDEAITFRDPTSPTLRNRNVVIDSIVITDASNLRVLQRGIDFRLRKIRNAVQIERILTGNISDSDTVLVDYQFETPEDGSLDTTRVDFNLEQRFANGLTPYYRLSYRNQEDEESTGFARRADRTNHHRVGIKYATNRYSVAAEYEVFDDTVEPYDAFHLRGSVALVQRLDHQVDAATRFSRLSFEGGLDRRDIIMIDVELDHRWQLNENISTIERVAYRFEDDSRDGVTHSWDASAGVEYVWGDLTGEITLDYDHLGLPRSDQDDVGVYFRVRRSFPNVLGRR